MKWLFTKSLRKHHGTVLLALLLILTILSETVIYINKIYNASFDLLSLQLRQDAHALSVEAFYAETLNQISWVNKQLKRIALLAASLVAFPKLLLILKKLDIFIRGLKEYQDFLIKSLGARLFYYDQSISIKNSLCFTLKKELYDVPYKRGMGLKLLVVNIPGLIKFNKKIFKTSCIEYQNIFSASKVCLEYRGSDKNTIGDWFSPKEEKWNFVYSY